MAHSYHKFYINKFRCPILGVSFLLFMIIASQFSFSAYASSDAYNSGYDHGCDDAGISDPNDRYYNQPEKGPSFHTDAFNNGYDEGFDACSGNNVGGNNGNGEDERDNGGSTSNSGYEFTVRVSEWPFGSSSVRIDIETENGYSDSSSVSTAVSGTPSHTFNIPQNQGNSVSVCTDPEGILAFGTCQTFITNGRDSSGTISAR